MMRMDTQEPNVSEHENAIAQSLLEKSDAEISSSGNVASPVSQPDNLKSERSRSEYRWSKAARELVRANLAVSGKELSDLLTRLEDESGNPRRACRRFVRRMGVKAKRPQRLWTVQEQQRLIKLLDLHPVAEIAKLLRRSQSAIWHMLQRLGANAKMGKDSFTKYTLSVALHVRPEKVEEWIGRGWLKAREIETGRSKRMVIDAEEFCEFCRKHTRDVVGNRLSKERLEFIYHFAFPSSHSELLPVRESKKERSAYETQLRENEDIMSNCVGGATEENGDSLPRTA